LEHPSPEQVAAGKLSTGGNPLFITAGVSDIKTKRATLKQISFQTIMELSNVLELSKNKTKKLCTALRRNLGSTTTVESNIFEKMDSIQDKLGEFYETKTENFLHNDEITSRSLVYVKDTSDFLRSIIEERGLDIHNSIVRISVDGGQDFLKVIVNVFDPAEKHSTSALFDDSGVKRCFVLAIVEDVSEDNGNLQKVLSPLNLDDVSYHIALDLKCANSVLGLSSHAGKFSCLYCEGECTLDPGIPRTFGSIDDHYQRYVEDGKKRSRMKEYKNVINPRLIYLDESPDVLLHHRIPPPELHILMGVLTKLALLLLTLWPQFESWMKSNYVMLRGYQGVGFDGNNANRLLSLLSILDRDLRADGRLDLLPIIDCLTKFAAVKENVFGIELGLNIPRILNEFKNSFSYLQKYVQDIFELNLTVSWKVHIAVCHILPYIEKNKTGLGNFAEQTGEAIHHQFKKTWINYKRSVNHSEHGRRLQNAVVQFGIHNM